MKSNSNGGTVTVEHSGWNSEVEQSRWNSNGGTVKVEQ